MLSVLSPETPISSRPASPTPIKALKHHLVAERDESAYHRTVSHHQSDSSFEEDIEECWEERGGGSVTSETEEGCREASRSGGDRSGDDDEIQQSESATNGREEDDYARSRGESEQAADDRQIISKMMEELGRLQENLAQAKQQDDADALSYPDSDRGSDPEEESKKHVSMQKRSQVQHNESKRAVQRGNERIPAPKPAECRRDRAVADLLETMYKENSKAQALERQLHLIATRPIIRADIGVHVEDMHANEISNEANSAAEQYSDLKAIIGKLWAHIDHPKPGQTYIASMKMLMETIEGKIMVYRTSLQKGLQTLTQQEKTLSAELAMFTENMAVWDQMDDTAAESGPTGRIKHAILPLTRTSGHEDGHLLPEVVAYQNFLTRHGGRFGGWEEFSHNAFVKLREKHGTDTNAFLQACMSHIPGIGYDEASSHETWYQSLIRLTEARKAAIATWKQRKAVTAEKQEKAMETKEKKGVASGSTIESNRIAREAQKRELEAWKAQKKVEEEALMAKQLRQEAEKLAEQQRWREQKRLQKECVNVYVQQRKEQYLLDQQMRTEMEDHDRALRMRLAQQDAKRLAEKNMDYVRKRRAGDEAKSKAAAEKEQRLAKLRKKVFITSSPFQFNQSKAFNIFDQVEVHTTRDPSRILQPTAAFQTKVDSPAHEPHEKANAQFKTNPLPRRQIPCWRREI
ncbi:hypothetical protein DFJ77DRAFT_511548 [Powellomyces hirtus]|nr:hypothetical protein DFJ77DRAFT_511548 [Powellomyces hirtus]